MAPEAMLQKRQSVISRLISSLVLLPEGEGDQAGGAGQQGRRQQKGQAQAQSTDAAVAA
jgi:hypothetical protein